MIPTGIYFLLPLTIFNGVVMKSQIQLICILFTWGLAGCGADDTAVTANTPVAEQSPGKAIAQQPAPSPVYEAGPKFCGKIQPTVIMAAFEFGLKLADVSVAEESECHYNLISSGTDPAILIYRMQPIVMYQALKESNRKTADIPNLGEEAFLLGNAQIDVKLDDEHAFEVALQIINTDGQPLMMTPEKAREGLIRFAGMLSLRL